MIIYPLDPEYDLSTLNKEEVVKFYQFAEISLVLLKTNKNKKTFWRNLQDIINGV